MIIYVTMWIEIKIKGLFLAHIALKSEESNALCSLFQKEKERNCLRGATLMSVKTGTPKERILRLYLIGVDQLQKKYVHYYWDKGTHQQTY